MSASEADKFPITVTIRGRGVKPYDDFATGDKFPMSDQSGLQAEFRVTEVTTDLFGIKTITAELVELEADGSGQ